MKTGIYQDKEKRRKYLREYMRDWRNKNPISYDKYKIKQKGYQKEYYRNLRLKALDLLGGRKCENCGCDNLKILEINHKNGGGCKEHKQIKSKKHYLEIIQGRKNKEDYNVLCRVCNSQHYVESILKIKGHKISWQK